MKKTILKVLASMLVLAMAITALVIPSTSAKAADETIYLKPNSNWLKDGARFAAVLANSDWSTQEWVDLTDFDSDGNYECVVPSGKDYSLVIFCRMNPSTTANNWDNKWNQTADLTIPTNGNNLYTVADGTWDKGGGVWSIVGGGEADVTYYLAGDFNNWSVASEDYKLTKDGSDYVYTKTLAAGKYQAQVTDGTWNTKYPSNAYSFELTEECEVTFKLTSGILSVTGDSVYKSYYVRGNMTGENWDVNENYRMSKVENGYSWTGVLAAGSYSYKVADTTWGEGYPSTDQSFTLDAESTVTITLSDSKEVALISVPVDTDDDDDDDTNTEDDTNTDDDTNTEDDTNAEDDANTEDDTNSEENTNDVEKYVPVFNAATIAGDFKALTGANITTDWDVAAGAADMTHIGNGIYVFELTFAETTAEVTVNYKVAFNNAWDTAIGYDYTNKEFSTAPGCENLYITVPAGTTSVKIYADENGLVAYNTIQNPTEAAALLAIASTGDFDMTVVYMLLFAGFALVAVGVVSKKKFA